MTSVKYFILFKCQLSTAYITRWPRLHDDQLNGSGNLRNSVCEGKICMHISIGYFYFRQTLLEQEAASTGRCIIWQVYFYESTIRTGNCLLIGLISIRRCILAGTTNHREKFVKQVLSLPSPNSQTQIRYKINIIALVSIHF